MPTNGDRGPRQFFENPPRLPFPADDSAVHQSNLGLILTKEVVKIDNVQSIILAEEPERSLWRKPSPNCKNYILSLKRSRRIRSIRLNPNLHGARWAVYLKIHKQLLFNS